MPQPSVISVAEAATSLGLSGRQVRRLIASKILPAQKVGSGFIIRRADLAKVPKERKPGPKPKGK
jgi:excisionase family DNA binding protein